MEDSSSSKKIAKNTLFLYIRMFLVMIVSLYTVRVVLRTLGVEDYGIYSAVGGIITSLAFITGVLANASQRFLSIGIGKGDRAELNRTFSIIVFLYIGVGIMVFLLAETVGLWFLINKMSIPETRYDAAFWVFQCTIISFAISVISSPYQAMIIANEKMDIYAFVGIIDVILKLLMAYFLICVDTDKLKLYASLMVCITFIGQAIYVTYSLCKYTESRVKLFWDTSIVKSVFSFSTWSLFGSLAFIANTQGLNLVLNVFFGPIVNAAYMIGNQVKTTVNLFASNFYVAVRPAMMKEYAKGNMNYVRKLFLFSTKTLFALLFVVVFPISMEIGGILQLWLGEVGDYMEVFVRLMLIYAIILSISDPITTIVQAANKVKKYHLIVDGFTLLTLPLTYMAFMFKAPPATTFIISIIVFIIAHIIRLVIVKPLVGISMVEYFNKIIFRFIMTIVLSLVLSLLFTQWLPDSIQFLFLSLAYDFVLAAVICFYFLLDAQEKQSLINIVKQKIRKK